VMLYGISLLYGATGTTNLHGIALRLGAAPTTLKLLAVTLILVGFGFKISMVPFHQWTPDVYEGAPTPITAFLSVGPKAAGFAVLFRVLWTGLPEARIDVPWSGLLALLCVATMTVGNLLALVQHNVKRMLAYSSIAHAGYMLIGVVVIASSSAPGGDMAGVFGVMVYLMAYLFMNIGAFAIVIWFARSTGSEKIDDYAGLADKAPLFAAALPFSCCPSPASRRRPGSSASGGYSWPPSARRITGGWPLWGSSTASSPFFTTGTSSASCSSAPWCGRNRCAIRSP